MFIVYRWRSHLDPLPRPDGPRGAEVDDLDIGASSARTTARLEADDILRLQTVTTSTSESGVQYSLDRCDLHTLEI